MPWHFDASRDSRLNPLNSSKRGPSSRPHRRRGSRLGPQGLSKGARVEEGNEIRDLADVAIPAGAPVEERIASFVEQVGNPYEFTSHGVRVRVSFAGQVPIEDAVARLLGLESE